MRWAVILVTLSALTFLCLWGAAKSPWLSLEEATNNPKTYDGATINMFLYPRITEIYADGFLLTEHGDRSIRVYCDTTGLILGKWVGLEAVYHQEGYLIARNVGVARHRSYKVYLSLLPVLLIGVLWIRTYKLDQRRMVFILRNHA